MSSKWTERLARTFGLRLALWYFLLFAGSTMVVVWLTYVLLGQSLERRDREVVVSTLSRYVGQYLQGGLEALRSTIESDRLAGRGEPLFVRVLGRGEGALFFAMPPGWGDFDLSRLAAPDLLGGQTWSELSAGNGNELLEVASVRLGDGTLFQVGKSTRGREELLERYREVLAGVLVVVVAVGLVGGLALTWSALQPIRDVTKTVRSIMATGDMSARVPARQTGDALDELGLLMNDLLARIETLLRAMKGSLDNVAHDLRTPLARLRATAETTLSRPADLESCREALSDCIEESERVTNMLDTLMDVSEAETGVLQLRREATPVPELIEDVASLFADVAEDKGVSLRGEETTDGMSIDADRARIRRVLANLVDNAVKYTPPGGSVAVRARRAGEVVLISVEDTGPGISPEDLPRIWDRLYRGDKSRSERGLGLGLSLVRAIVEAHGGRVSVESEPGKGARFTIAMPAAKPYTAVMRS